MNKLISFLAKYDIPAHIIIEGLITFFGGLIIWWLGMLIAVIVGLAKEFFIDAYADKKDLICDAVGICLGLGILYLCMLLKN